MRTQETFDHLWPVTDSFPQVGTVPYNRALPYARILARREDQGCATFSLANDPIASVRCIVQSDGLLLDSWSPI
jgi:hypothetical protein